MSVVIFQKPPDSAMWDDPLMVQTVVSMELPLKLSTKYLAYVTIHPPLVSNHTAPSVTVPRVLGSVAPTYT